MTGDHLFEHKKSTFTVNTTLTDDHLRICSNAKTRICMDHERMYFRYVQPLLTKWVDGRIISSLLFT